MVRGIFFSVPARVPVDPLYCNAQTVPLRRAHMDTKHGFNPRPSGLVRYGHCCWPVLSSVSQSGSQKRQVAAGIIVKKQNVEKERSVYFPTPGPSAAQCVQRAVCLLIAVLPFLDIWIPGATVRFYHRSRAQAATESSTWE